MTTPGGFARFRPDTVAVIGLGLMGGSLARDLSAQGIDVIAFDRSDRVLDAALSEGVISRSLAIDFNGVADADLIVIATPVDVALDVLDRVAPLLSETALVTDLGSTKRQICDRAAHLGLGDRFVGSHPLAGDHRSGWNAARLGLYSGVPVFVSPAAPDSPSLNAIVDFWRCVGASPAMIDAADHDCRMAWISHLPQVVSSALATTLADASLQPSTLGAGGRDMTRLAASSPEMWAAICRANKDFLTVAIDELLGHLGDFRGALENPDPEALRALFRRARTWTE